MTRERYRGALLGLAAGDALGTTLEQFAKRQDVPLLPAAPVCCFNRESRLIS